MLIQAGDLRGRSLTVLGWFPGLVSAGLPSERGPLLMPYFDINPRRQRPKWVGFVVLAVLAVLTVGVVAAALSRK